MDRRISRPPAWVVSSRVPQPRGSQFMGLSSFRTTMPCRGSRWSPPADEASRFVAIRTCQGFSPSAWLRDPRPAVHGPRHRGKPDNRRHRWRRFQQVRTSPSTTASSSSDPTRRPRPPASGSPRPTRRRRLLASPRGAVGRRSPSWPRPKPCRLPESRCPRPTRPPALRIRPSRARPPPSRRRSPRRPSWPLPRPALRLLGQTPVARHTSSRRRAPFGCMTSRRVTAARAGPAHPTRPSCPA